MVGKKLTDVTIDAEFDTKEEADAFLINYYKSQGYKEM